MVVALLALSVALGGSAYAVTRIDGRSLKDRSVRAGKIARNSLTGTEINERKLGRVPSSVLALRANLATQADLATTAASAASASSASNAEKLGGLLPGAFEQGGGEAAHASLTTPSGTTDRPLLAVGGLGTVLADCAGATASLRLRNDSGVALGAVVQDAPAGGLPQVSATASVAASATLPLTGAPRSGGISRAVVWNASGTPSATVVVGNVGCSFGVEIRRD
jgi:hypothetical protein